MLAGRLSHYRATSPAARLADLAVTHHGDPTGTRRALEPRRATGYRPTIHSLTGQPAAMVLPE
ncbi:hypothetical protein ABZU53_12820 [Micromonospora sp. NPDC005194]|uniref:hypothetical protein n=1 Tax=Micromonospora sp. NPDC005194 TaxID=3156870 RepID=UPI0033B9F2DB